MASKTRVSVPCQSSSLLAAVLSGFASAGRCHRDRVWERATFNLLVQMWLRG